MSKKKMKLELGNFYMIYGGGRHPSLVYAYDEKHNTYISIKFGTSGGKHMIKILPIQKGYSDSFVHSRPFEGTRNDYGDYILIGLSINPNDENTIKTIKGRKHRLTKNAKKRYKKSR